jgi:hypothetical protein
VNTSNHNPMLQPLTLSSSRPNQWHGVWVMLYVLCLFCSEPGVWQYCMIPGPVPNYTPTLPDLSPGSACPPVLCLQLQSSDAIMFVRPTHIPVHAYRPLPPLEPGVATLQQLPAECAACQASDKAHCPLDGNRGPDRGSKGHHVCPLADTAPEEEAPHRFPSTSSVSGVVTPLLHSLLSAGGDALARLKGATGAGAPGGGSNGAHPAAAALPTLGGRKLVAMPQFVWSSGSSLDEPSLEHTTRAAAAGGAPAPLGAPASGGGATGAAGGAQQHSSTASAQALATAASAGPAAATDVLIAQLSGRAASAPAAATSSGSSSMGGGVPSGSSSSSKGSGSSSVGRGSARDEYSPGITPSRPASPVPTANSSNSSSNSSSHPNHGASAAAGPSAAGAVPQGHPLASMAGVYMEERRGTTQQQHKQGEAHPATTTGSSSSGDLLDSPDSSADHGEHHHEGGTGLAAAWTSWINPGGREGGEEGGGGVSAAVARAASALTGLGGGGAAAPAGAGGGGGSGGAGGGGGARPVDATILIPQEYLQVGGCVAGGWVTCLGGWW